MKDRSKPGDRRRQVLAQRAAEARLQHLIESQHRNRDQIRRQAAADGVYGYGDLPISRGD